MKLLALIEFLRARKRLVIACTCAALGLLVLIDMFLDKHHAHTQVEHLPGFWAVFGFLACAAIIYLSKWFGKAGILTREDFYDE